MYWILLIFIIILIRYYFVHQKLNGIKEVKNINFKSCDIVLFKSDGISPSNIFQMIFNGTPFTHMGIVYKKDGELYILESHPKHYSSKDKCTGVCLYKLKDRMTSYKGSFYIDQFDRELTDEEHKKYDKFVKYIQQYNTFPTNGQIAVNYFNRCILDRKISLPVHCSELVTYVLKNICNCKIHVGCSYPYKYFGELKKMIL